MSDSNRKPRSRKAVSRPKKPYPGYRRRAVLTRVSHSRRCNGNGFLAGTPCPAGLSAGSRPGGNGPRLPPGRCLVA